MSKHKQISLIKSVFRIFGYALVPIDIPWAVGTLILSELLGILEEIGEK